jgi:hypothetical protein
MSKWLPSPDRLGGYYVPSITLTAWFHAYILCGVIGLSRGRLTPTSAYACTSKEMHLVLREYLTYACGDDEWTKGRILEAMRFKTQTAMKADARRAFPSLFPRNKRARPLGVPNELKNETVVFDIERIKKWREQVRGIKKEITMNENATATTEETSADRSTETDAGSNSRVTVNFFIPKGVNVEDLTLKNYLQVTGKRFRMTKDQAKVRGLSREDAFAESKALAISQLGEK